MKGRKKQNGGFLYLLSQIPAVDKCLIIIFTVLLTQAVFSLFAGDTITAEAEHIDIVIRTSMAGIFGYFLSANFIRNSKQEPNTSSLRETGLLSSQSTDETEFDRIDNTFSHSQSESEHLQIWIASAICLFCLIILLIYRNTDLSAAAAEQGNLAAAAQLRDFVSGCVGFLIGSPADGSKNK